MTIILFASEEEAREYQRWQAIKNGMGISGISAGKAALSYSGAQYIVDCLSQSIDGIQTVQLMLSRSGIASGEITKAIQTLRGALKSATTDNQMLINRICESITATQNLINHISGDGAGAINTTLLEIAERDIVQSLQTIISELSDPKTQIIAYNWDIYLDGVSVKRLITGIDIKYSENSIHNHITIKSIDRELFQRANPAVLPGEARIEVHLENRVMLFLLEEKSGDEINFSLWGRSLSARADYPHASLVDTVLDAPQSAHELIEMAVSRNAVDWDIPDWALPAGYEFEGFPIELAHAVAEIAGAVIRCQDDGSLLIRRRYPTRPVDTANTRADADYDRKNMISISHSEEKGKGYDSVYVYGHADEVQEPIIQVQNEQHTIGQDVYVHVYWGGKRPANIDTFLTSGVATLIEKDRQQIIGRDEPYYAIFKDGSCTVEYPVSRVIGYEWIGYDGGEITYQKNSKMLMMSDVGGAVAAVAKLIYETSYDLYRIQEHYVPILIATLKQPAQRDVSLKVSVNGKYDHTAPDIIDNAITSQAVALERGRAFLDANRYDRRKFSLRVPYSPVVDGQFAYINDANIGLSGNCHITDVSINFQGPAITNTIEVEQCRI